jgi:hypothetical protein
MRKDFLIFLLAFLLLAIIMFSLNFYQNVDTVEMVERDYSAVMLTTEIDNTVVSILTFGGNFKIDSNLCVFELDDKRKLKMRVVELENSPKLMKVFSSKSKIYKISGGDQITIVNSFRNDTSQFYYRLKEW